mmetsp:Transcript_80077/g.166569  ORF Transcript_80077/g.166569 Transcript_80077/m.166569 type:complete len:84 (-) Transcript_80077:1874-2125(-)
MYTIQPSLKEQVMHVRMLDSQSRLAQTSEVNRLATRVVPTQWLALPCEWTPCMASVQDGICCMSSAGAARSTEAEGSKFFTLL